MSSETKKIMQILSIVMVTGFFMAFISCSISSQKISNEKRISIEYLNSAAEFLQKGQTDEAVLLIESNFKYIIQTDDFNINTRYIATLIKVLNLYGMHEKTLPFISRFLKSKDFMNSDAGNKRILNFLYVETLIKNGAFDSAKTSIHELLNDKGYHSKYLHIIYAYFFMLYRAQKADFTDSNLINTLLEQKSDEFSKMVFIKNLALYYFDRKEYSRAISLFLQYNEFVRNAGYINEIASSYLYLGRLYLQSEKYSTSSYCFNKAYYIYYSLDDYINSYMLLEELAELYDIHGMDSMKPEIDKRMKTIQPAFEQDQKNRERSISILLNLLMKFDYMD